MRCVLCGLCAFSGADSFAWYRNLPCPHPDFGTRHHHLFQLGAAPPLCFQNLPCPFGEAETHTACPSAHQPGGGHSRRTGRQPTASPTAPAPLSTDLCWIQGVPRAAPILVHFHPALGRAQAWSALEEPPSLLIYHLSVSPLKGQ